jgi:hypothetical protein
MTNPAVELDLLTLLSLAPDIQEEILFLPPIERGCEPIRVRDLRKIAAVSTWSGQRTVWKTKCCGK